LNLCVDVVDLGLLIVNVVGLSCVSGEIILPSKGPLIRALVSSPKREPTSHAKAYLDNLAVDGVLHVLGGCARAHPPDVAPELVSELETHPRAFIRDCSRCSLGMLRRGSLDHCGKCGRSYGRGHLGRRDGRDCSIMTARRHCRSTSHGNRGVARVGGCFAGALVWAKVSLTRWARRSR
jgi:hypothetical protein